MKEFNDICYMIRNLIISSNKLDIIIHKKPDGDALGALSAMLGALKIYENLDVKGICTDQVPLKYNFLPFLEDIREDVRPDSDLLIFLDCADMAMSGLQISLKHKIIVNIDHHITNLMYGQINLIDPDSSSTCEILFNLFNVIKIKINKSIATALFTGLDADTGSFQHSNTKISTLNSASKLLNYGVHLQKVAHSLYRNRSLAELKLWGLVFSRIKYFENLDIVVSQIFKKDLDLLSLKPEALEGLSNFLATIPNVKVAILLQESDNNIKGSLRTEHNQVDVAKIAKIFGGGGHKKAAGFEIPKTINSFNNLTEVLQLNKIKKYLFP